MAKKQAKPVVAKTAKTEPVVPSDVVLMSLWRNDVGRDQEQRIEHLLAKESVTRWVWVTGNNNDATEEVLARYAAANPAITLIHYDSEDVGTNPDERLMRLSQTASVGLDDVREGDAFWCVHESDLISPVDVVTRLLQMQGDEPKVCAGMVWLGEEIGRCWYDTYAYRWDGGMFQNAPPYHSCVNLQDYFEVHSAGSVVLMPAAPLRDGIRMERGGLVELSYKLRDAGYRIVVDPKLNIIQPIHLWTSAAHASY